MSESAVEIAQALRRHARAENGDPIKVLPGLLSALAELPAGHGDAPQGAATVGEVAWQLFSVVRTLRDVALASRVLQALASLGRFGRCLAMLHIQARSLPLPQVTPILQALSSADYLSIVNEMCLSPQADDKQYTAWLKSLLPTPARCDPKGALQFLGTLADEGTPLAKPLRDALLSSCLAEALPNAFAGKPGATTAGALLKAAESLSSPAIHVEALGYALRVSGADGPSRLAPLLGAAPDLEVREPALLVELRRLAATPDAPRLLLPAAKAEPELLGLVLADMLRQGGETHERALSLAPLLPRLGLASLLPDVPAADREAVMGRVFLALARVEAEFLRRAAKALQSMLDKASVQALAQIFSSQTARDAAESATLLAPPAAAKVPAKAASQRRPSLAEALKDALSPLKDQDYSNSTLSGESLEGSTLTSVNLSASQFSSVTFRRLRLSNCNLAGCRFESCTFQGCTFSAVDLCGAQFQGCTFSGCALERCDAARLRLSSCTVSRCALTESCLAETHLTKVRMDRITARACSFSGLRAQTVAQTHSSFARCDLSGSVLERSVWRGFEFQDCALAHARLRHCEVQGGSFARCSMRGISVLGGHTDNPHLAEASWATLAELLSGGDPALVELPPALRTESGAAFVAACVGRYVRLDEARRTLAAMRGQNQRRMELARERLTEAQGVFLTLLPQLLVTDVFEKAQGLGNVPACALGGPEVRVDAALLEKYFPGQAPTAKAAPLLTIDALYAIGSLGSVAQKPSSDIDCWVCHNEPEGSAQEVRDGLRRKLAALEVWADQQFGLEVHFFAMTLDEVRTNSFGMSDKESSGSAQAALLKEEFYRTALRLAGKDLLWWAAPPGADAATAQSLLAEISVLDPRLAGELVDLGQPEPIPASEYFGACLWQMVKALHSPYKSVMKLGLLEKYADKGQTMRLLCDRIKEAVMRGRSRLEWVDPYLALFSSIHSHYAALGDEGALGLLAECLWLKADVEAEYLPPEFSQVAQATWATDTFANSMRLGGLVNQFMIAAYRRIQGGLKADRASASITPQDLTRLGRRIASNFAQHEHKVSLVPFLSEDVAFTELYFYAEKAPGKRTVWAVKGKEKATGKAAVESLEPIRRDTDVARLLAWIVVNGIYVPGLAVQAEKTLAPIAVMDMQALLQDLTTFFPRHEILNPDMEEYLRDEQVTRAYVILNLPVPPDKNKILQASVIYATNWGELFCQGFDNPPQLLSLSPLTFLRENLARTVPSRPEVKIFIPKKSACPRIKAF
ncbi:MAG: class I adenylate cyclase [Humidesulfovibrio sp.]|uniref:class I adenylate cyclase n=1 Tax=Humidesulfovibrio sp. TaxID=2910988 RepID=UPI0027E62AF6|nr:class I adenylate cyclase [Humidesulfovibrio sp.]MDQ7835170.1 class I adenylate cyclase [Humidesulfovibrio sp.]